MSDVIVMRHRFSGSRTGQEPSDVIRMTTRRTSTSVGTGDLDKKLFFDPTDGALPSDEGVVPYRCLCEDGVEFFLDCNEHTLLTGLSSVREVFRNHVIDYAMQCNVPVLVITSKPDERYTFRNDRRRLIRRIDANAFTSGFYPFPGWSLERATRCIETFLLNDREYANVHRQQIIRVILQLLARKPEIGQRLVNGEISQLQDILRMIPADAAEDDTELQDAVSLLRGDVVNTNQVLSGLYSFLSICVRDTGRRENGWTLASPGITIVNAQQNSYSGQQTGGWYLQRMAPFVKEDLAEKGVSLLLVVDDVDEETLRFYDPFINYSASMLLVVSDSIISVSQSIRSKLTRQIVFCQTDGEAARYWSEMAGRRNIMEEDRTYTSAETHRPFTIFPITTYTQAKHQGYQYRAYYEPDELMAMDDRSGFLFTRGYRTSFHRFYCNE